MVIMGKVVAAHGIKGWVKIQPYTEYLDSLLDYDSWFVGKEGDWLPVEVLEAEVHSKVLVVRLEGVDDRTAAEKYKGQMIAVSREEFPEEDEGEYYWSDLIGSKVLNLAGEELGEVDTLMETGANDVLVVRGGQGEVLIPFIESVIRQVDKQHKTIQVDWQADYLK